MEEAQLKMLKTHFVDTRARCGSGTLLEARIALSKIPKGDVLEAISSEEETKPDVRLWAGHTGQEFLGVIPGDGFERIFVRRRQ
ncbi:MAG: sulfurtransferase TusA family protein [Thermoplasmata archaeon]